MVGQTVTGASSPSAYAGYCTSSAVFNPFCSPPINAAIPAHSISHQVHQKQPSAAFFQAIGLLMAGLLLNRLPARVIAAEKIPSDWKIWAKLILGIQAVGQLNAMRDTKPAPWLGAMESVAGVTLLMHGLNRKSLAQAAVLMPWVAGLVQTASTTTQALQRKLGDRVPPWLSRLAVSVVTFAAGIKLTPALFKLLAKQPLFKSWSGLAVASEGAMAGMSTCARGCTPGGVICMSELGELLGGFGHWWKTHTTTEKDKS